MPITKIKELRRWHRQRSYIWRLGYDTYGNYIANKLVKGSPFWSRVTEAGHTAFVERRVTPMSCLAVLVIAPGSAHEPGAMTRTARQDIGVTLRSTNAVCPASVTRDQKGDPFTSLFAM